MSPKVKKLFSNKRQYSTALEGVDENSHLQVTDIYKIDNNKPIIFDSLEQACDEIKYKYIGVSGVYKLTNKKDLSRFYIGSSINLARRMEEYYKLTNNF